MTSDPVKLMDIWQCWQFGSARSCHNCKLKYPSAGRLSGFEADSRC